MPSAEKSSLQAAKLEGTPPVDPKSVENSQKEASSQDLEKLQTPIQQVISIISNKVRNLEKRKNKLDGYIKEEESGKALDDMQQMAVSKYEEVVQQLSLSKEFCKQFQAIAVAASKEAKREARKNMFSRQNQETAKIREVLMIQELLARLKDDGVRKEFLNGRNGACRISKAELEFLDKFAQQVVPLRPNFSNEPDFSSAAKASAEQWSLLIDGRNRAFVDTGMTYEKAKELLNRIQSCGYWEKGVKVVEVTEPSRAENDTPNTDDLESKESNSETAGEKVQHVLAPAPAQVPTPTFNGNLNSKRQQPTHQAPMARNHRHQQQQQQAQLSAPTNAPMNNMTAVTAVEKAYYNHLQYSQPQGQILNNNGLPVAPTQNDFSNFSFLQESELDAAAGLGSHSKMPVNVIQKIMQPEQSPVQQVAAPTQQPYKTNANFHSQSSIGAAQMFPPGLKVQQHALQNQAPHIPVNYQPNPQLNQQNAVSSSQVPPNMIPKQPQPVNGSGYGATSQTPPMQQQVQQQPSRPAAYPSMPKAQYQQNLKSAPKMDGSGDSKGARQVAAQEKERPREDYQQQPQIDTWTNETAAQAGATNSNFSSSRTSGGGYNNRNNRAAATGGGAKPSYNNYRNPQQSRNENGGGDSPRDGQAPGTFFRNNDRYNERNNGSSTPSTRHDNRSGGGAAAAAAGGNFKHREGPRAGSGRFAGSASASAGGSSNPTQRK